MGAGIGFSRDGNNNLKTIEHYSTETMAQPIKTSTGMHMEQVLQKQT